MPRVKRGKTHIKKRKKLLKKTKGYFGKRRTTIKQARQSVLKAGAQSYRDRRKKKRTMRRLWITRLNAAVREHDLTYSEFIKLLKKNKIEIDRKILSEIAQKNPAIFKKIVEQAKK